MNGDYQSYYPQFEANQVLTSSHLNELRQYLDEQIRLTRSQLTGVGIACGLTFDYDATRKVFTLYEGFGVTSEGYLLHYDGQHDASPNDPTNRGRYSELVKYRVYTDPSPDLYWYNGTETTPVQLELFELLTEADAQQAIIDGAPPTSIKAITAGVVQNKVVVLYLEQNDIALKTCVGKDCDHRGSKRQLTPRILLVQKGAVAQIQGLNKGVGILSVGLDGLLVQTPPPKPMRVPRFINGINRNNSPLDGIVTFPPIGNAYLTAIDTTWIDKLIAEIKRAFNVYGPFLGLTRLDISLVDGLKTKLYTPTTAQYAHDWMKDLARALNEFEVLAYELKKDCCNEEYRFCKHLMLGAVAKDDTKPYDEYRNYFVRFGMTWAQDRRLRIAQMLFRRLLLQIKAVTFTPPNQLAGDNTARIVPSQEDTFPVGKGAIPDYYVNGELNALSLVWDPERSLEGLASEVLSFAPGLYSAKDHVLTPLAHDIDDMPFLRIQNLLGTDLDASREALELSKKLNGLAFDVVPVLLANELPLAHLREALLRDDTWAIYEQRYQSLRILIDRAVATFQGAITEEIVTDLQAGIAFFQDLVHRFIRETPVLENLRLMLGAASFFDFIVEDGQPSLVRGKVPRGMTDSFAALFSHMYLEARSYAQYLAILISYRRTLVERKRRNACDHSSVLVELRELEERAEVIHTFLNDHHWAVLEGMMATGKDRLAHVRSFHLSLFKNFAAKYPGIEHLGGVYKGGTYVLVYEETQQLIKTNAGGGKLENEIKRFFTGGFTVKHHEPIEFGAEFSVGDEWVMDLAFTANYENENFREALRSVIFGMDKGQLSEKETEVLKLSTAESMFANYLEILGRRIGRQLNEKELAAVEAEYRERVAALRKSPGQLGITVEMVDEYLANLGKEGSLEILIPTENEPTKEELSAMRKLVLELITSMDRGFLNVEATKQLDGLNLHAIWPGYLEIVAKAMGSALSAATVGELTKEYQSLLDSITPSALLKFGIGIQAWASYVESIRTGQRPVKVAIGEPKVSLMDFLITEIQRFGKVRLADGDFGRLRTGGVDSFWRNYIDIYARALGGLRMDLDTQRGLTNAFKTQLLETNPQVAEDGGFEKELKEFLDLLDRELENISPEPFGQAGLLGDLMDFLVRILRRVEDPYEKRFGQLLDGGDYENLAKLSPEELWPAYEAMLLRVSEKLTREDLEGRKRAFLELLRQTDVARLVENGLFDQVQVYIHYLEGATASDNPFLRKALMEVVASFREEVLKSLKLEEKKELVLEGGEIKRIRTLELEGKEVELPVSEIWPAFVREYFRITATPYDPQAALSLQRRYVDKLMTAERTELQKLGIQSQWFAYTSELMGDLPVGEDRVGALVVRLVSIMEKLGPAPLDKDTYAALRLLQPEVLFDTWTAQLKGEKGQALDKGDIEKLREQYVEAVQRMGREGILEKDLEDLWRAYLEFMSPRETQTVIRRVVADFSLPYPVRDLMGFIRPDPAQVPLPLVAGLDRVLMLPGTTVDIPILVNDSDPSGRLLQGNQDIEVQITDVIHPPGGLGGQAYLIADPLSPIPNDPLHILRYEAFFGIPLGGGEMVEINYLVRNKRTSQTATGRVIVLVHPELPLATDPCCCCDDYSFVIERHKMLETDVLESAFKHLRPYVVMLVDSNGQFVKRIDTPDYVAELLPEAILRFTSLGRFEGSVRLNYHIAYSGGDAECTGVFTIHVVCDCMAGPCAHHVDAKPGEIKEVKDILSKEEIEEGVILRLNNNGQAVTTTKEPDANFVGVKIGEQATKNPIVITFETTKAASGTGHIPFFKGRMINEVFVVDAECTLDVAFLLGTFAIDAVMTNDLPKTLDGILSSEELSQGMEARFVVNGQPSLTIVPIPAGILRLELVPIGRGRPNTAFFVEAQFGFTGDVQFDYFKGKVANLEQTFVPSMRGTMTLTVQAPTCIRNYEMFAGRALDITDLLDSAEIANSVTLAFDDKGDAVLSPNVLPQGVRDLTLISVPPSYIANTGFQVTAIRGYLGPIEWRFHKVRYVGGFLERLGICTIHVDVKEFVPACVHTYQVGSGLETPLRDLLTYEEYAKGMQLRFTDGEKLFSYTPLTMPEGTDLLDIFYYYDQGNTIQTMRFRSKPGFEGKLDFLVARGRESFAGGDFLPEEICKVNIEVSPANIFTKEVTVQTNGSITVGGFITDEDLKAGLELLVLTDSIGTPVKFPNYHWGNVGIFAREGDPKGTTVRVDPYYYPGRYMVDLGKCKFSEKLTTVEVRGVLIVNVVTELVKDPQSVTIIKDPYSFDSSFQTSTYYNPSEPVQTETLRLLDGLQKILNDSDSLRDLRDGNLDIQLGYEFSNLFTALQAEAVSRSVFTERNYYMRLYAIVIDALIATTLRKFEPQRGDFISNAYDVVTQGLSEFRNLGYYDPNGEKDRIALMLRNTVVPSDRGYMTYAISQWLGV